MPAPFYRSQVFRISRSSDTNDRNLACPFLSFVPAKYFLLIEKQKKQRDNKKNPPHSFECEGSVPARGLCFKHLTGSKL